MTTVFNGEKKTQTLTLGYRRSALPDPVLAGLPDRPGIKQREKALARAAREFHKAMNAPQEKIPELDFTAIRS